MNAKLFASALGAVLLTGSPLVFAGDSYSKSDGWDEGARYEQHWAGHGHRHYAGCGHWKSDWHRHYHHSHHHHHHHRYHHGYRWPHAHHRDGTTIVFRSSIH
jgi:hypothetical protein